MRLLLCAEGPQDVGHPDFWDDRRKDYIVTDGWMQPILRKTIDDDLEFKVMRRDELQVTPRDPHRRRLPAGHGAKAYIAKRAAVTGGYDLLIFMVDADSTSVREWRRLVAEIKAGFDLLEGDVRCVACVPMAASESWLLADPGAWSEVAGYDGTALPSRPERIWGPRDDPNGNHPHRIFFRVCEDAGVPDSPDTRARIAESTDLVLARARCPVSLDTFIDAVRAA